MLASTGGLCLFSEAVVVGSLEILGFTGHGQLLRFPAPGMVSLLLSMVFSPAGKLLVTTKLCVPFLHPQGYLVMLFTVLVPRCHNCVGVLAVFLLWSLCSAFWYNEG